MQHQEIRIYNDILNTIKIKGKQVNLLFSGVKYPLTHSANSYFL